MSLSSDVNVEMLNDCFELGPFHGLREPDEEDITNPPDTPEPPPGKSRISLLYVSTMMSL